MRKDWVMLFLGLLFASVLWPLGAWFVYGTVRQAQTASWPAADEAQVLESRVVSRRGSKGSTTYRPVVKYRYRVGDKWHIDEQLSFSTGFGDSGGGYAQSVVSAHPAGSKTTVYVDPSDWTRSVLFRGMRDRDWKSLTWVGPLATIPLVLLWVFFASVVRSGRGHAGTVRVFDPAPGVSVFRDVGIGPWGSGLIALSGGMIVTMIVNLAFVDSNAREWLILGWCAAVVLAAGAWIGRWRWVKAGRKDGVINRQSGVLMPARGRKRVPDEIELSRVLNTTLLQDSSQSTNKTPHWRVHLVVEGEEKTLPIADIRQKADARDFENWVRERIALPTLKPLRRKAGWGRKRDTEDGKESED